MIELPDKQLFRPDEVADIFSVSKRTVYTWLDNGTLTGVKIAGTTVRVDRESIEGVISVIE
jgi:excisionase family DNA binding protein